MSWTISRRSFVGTAGAAAAGLFMAEGAGADAGLDFPLVDFHVHVEGQITIEKALEISQQRGVKFGVVEHAGTRENKYPRVLSNDDELKKYLAGLEGKPVFKGIQAEWLDWPSCFSKEVLALLDYTLGDAMTVRDADGRPRVKLWEPGTKIEPPEKFMDRYAEFHVEVMATTPLDILANTTYLPAALVRNYDVLWTAPRMKKVIDAAVKHGVALEISSSLKLPKLPFLRMAKEAGAKFSFGSNIRGPNVGQLDYCIEMAKALGLRRGDMFMPAKAGQKAVERRSA